MHLERIELSGFKSFADKTVIEFDQGVTAIVGPNGSGKSNVSEAVRWVLGEQSARNLRGTKMNDFVFAGSQSRKPVNIAEVTLVLNNADHSLPLDFTEISITRRINRNGESDCFINKKPCRLKDITDLLMDSGIGKDSFSMISQGKVEQIFQNKPSERRGIFEEAAGVARYKNRKTSAEKKLASTQEHLNRVEDILHEIQNQLEPLEKQRNTAIKYQAMKKELSDIEIALMVVEVETLNEKWQLNKQDIAHYQKQVSEMDQQQKDGEENVEKLKAASSQIEASLQTLQDRYVTLIRNIEQLEGQKNILEQKANYSAKNKEEQEKIVAQKQKLIASEKKRLQDFIAEKEQKSAVKKELTEKVQKLQEKVEQLSQNNTEWLQQLRDTYIEKLQLQSTNKNTLMYLEKNRAQAYESQEAFNKKFLHVQELLKESESILAAQEQSVLNLQDELSSSSAELEKVHTSLVEYQGTLEEDSQKISQLSKSLQQAEARKESLQELEDSYASYYQGVKEILKRRDVIRGIHGPIGELFQVPEEYTLAIDTALGSTIQHIVMEDTESASHAIAILKRNRLGRATFLPLTVIKGRSIPEYLIHDLSTLSGFVGIGSDLISYEEIYSSIAASLLGTTIVAVDLASGLEIAKRIDNRYRIVSLEGDVIHAGGSMTGGASKRQQGSSVFSRKNSIDKLTAYIEKHTVVLEKLEVHFQSKQQKVTELRSSREELQASVEKLRYDLERNQEKRQREEEKRNNLQEEKQALTYERKIINENQEELENEIKKESALKEELQQEILSLKKDMDDSALNEEDRRKKLEKFQADLQQSQQKLAILQEQEKQLRRDIQQVNQVIETESGTVQAIQENLAEVSVMENSEYQSIDEVMERLTVQTEEGSRLEAQLKEKRANKSSLQEELQTQEKNLQSVRSNVKRYLEELAKLESSASRSEVAIDHHLNRLSEEYGLSYEAAKLEYHLVISTDEASSQVKRLRQLIQDLGPINLASIEEYDRILERFEFLSKQQQDLITAKATLLQTMDEMDQEVATRFEQTFISIRDQFEKTFPRLFGGGKATIKLTEPDNILETGVEIVAQPPGKKLQQLSLLSGGEKAFTAIALLFAIIEVSPVPFCILDEVEAALDEANVVRFGRYLASFEKGTQFIVITHRKGTMEEADVLYGITMQESGVSRLASVKFEEEALLEE